MTPGVDHASVMVTEVIEALADLDEGVIVDGTVGPGGHAEALLRKTGEGVRLLALDRDPFAIEAASQRLRPFEGRVQFFQRGYEEIPQVLRQAGYAAAQRVLLDLGMSSVHLASGRGFSIQGEEPLDMRFDPSGPDETAARLLWRMPESELAARFVEIGQVPSAWRLARALKEEVRARRMRTMGDFRRVCHAVLGPRIRTMDSAILPAMVLRILVNREFERLETCLGALPSVVAPGGKVAVLAYHSGEDRLVKRAFRALGATGEWVIPQPKGIQPTREEVSRNPRARSARMRCIVRVRAESRLGTKPCRPRTREMERGP